MKLDQAADDAQEAVLVFLAAHGAAAIPALIGACVVWAVEHGAGDLIRSTLTNAIKLSRSCERVTKKERH